MRTLVAIPVYNEAPSLLRVVEAVRRHNDDVLVVDDGSTDDTGRLLTQLPCIAVMRHARNLGYGQSLIDAFAFAAAHRFDWCITLDCDEQHEPAWIPQFIAAAARGDCDVVSGSRYLTEIEGNSAAPSDRRRINAAVTDVLNCVLGLSLTDSFCGFKAHRVAAMRRLRLTEAGYAFPLQFWTQVAAHRLRVRELAVPRIYNDPNRHFGGVLDDPGARLCHYLDVLSQSLADAGMSRGQTCLDAIRQSRLSCAP